MIMERYTKSMKKMNKEKIENLSDELRMERLSKELKEQLDRTVEIQRQLDLTIAKHFKKRTGDK